MTAFGMLNNGWSGLPPWINNGKKAQAKMNLGIG
jgi:hypothetical protein